jgi:hypothetical protein
VGYKAVDGIVQTLENRHGILTGFPSGTLSPQPFEQGSREDLEKVANKVREKYGKDFPGAVESWDNFLRDAPQSDDVEDYVAKFPLYIPFKELLFGITSEMGTFASDRYDNICNIVMKNHPCDNIFVFQGHNLQRKLLNKTVIGLESVMKEKCICSQATCRIGRRLNLMKE